MFAAMLELWENQTQHSYVPEKYILAQNPGMQFCLNKANCL